MSVKRLIGLLGGTFDPIHYGHLRPALAARQKLDFDEVRLIPCAQPSLRARPAANPAQRLQMLELALQEFPELSADARELDREGTSFSIDTMQSLRDEHPDASLCWLLGMDAFAMFTSWYKWRQILDLVHLLVVRRPGSSAEFSEELTEYMHCRQLSSAEQLRQTTAGGILIMELDAPDISATQLRQRLANAETISGLTPEAVIKYIQNHPIY